ncbi:Hypothetical predicted protein [Lecanosticta acicola]|uniref:Uncharacterized protein n=1 Tax=Lecanosticta acicola TaxID=111012 RepID=A0AAI8YS75_9PEZI|nr:Hypothetical predicted protein [Lecanosticta acicola]
MVSKRNSSEAELPLRHAHEDRKRTRMDPATELRSNSSEETTVSEAPALRYSPGLERASTDPSSVSSESSDDGEDEDEDSELEFESDESEDDDEDDESLAEEEVRPQEERIRLGGPNKPDIDPKRVMEEAQKLCAKLQEFMPKLRAANSDLAEKGDKLNMENVEEGERHIEMSLGLGVLEEQKGEEEVALKDVQDRSEEVTEEEERGRDAMRELLGMDVGGVRPSIEEVQVATVSPGQRTDADDT